MHGVCARSHVDRPLRGKALASIPQVQLRGTCYTTVISVAIWIWVIQPDVYASLRNSLSGNNLLDLHKVRQGVSAE